VLPVKIQALVASGEGGAVTVATMDESDNLEARIQFR